MATTDSTPPRDAVRIALRQLQRDLSLTPNKRARPSSRSRSPVLLRIVRRLPAQLPADADLDTEEEAEETAIN